MEANVETNVAPENTESVNVAEPAFDPIAEAARILDGEEVNQEQSETQSQEESKQEVVEIEETQSEPVSKAWVKLQKKEQQLQQQANELRGLQEQFNAYQQAVQNAKTNPLQFLESVGLNLDSLTDYLIEGPQEPDPKDQALQELQEWKRQQEASMQAQQEAQMVQQYRSQLDETVANSDKFPLVKAEGANDVVWDVIVESAKNGTVLQVEEACEMVENYYVSLKAKFGQSNQGTASSQPKVTQQESISSTNSMPRTLSNQNSAAPSVVSQELSEEERVAEAARILEEGWS